MPWASTPRRNGSHGSDTLTSRSSTWSPFTERAVTPRRAERASGRLAVHSQHPSRLPRRCRPARRRFSTQSPRTQRAPPARGAVPRQDPQERLSGVRRGDTSRFTPRPGGGPGLDRHPKRCARALPGPVSPAQGCRSAGPVLPPPARSQAARVNASRRAAASSAGQQREPPPHPRGRGRAQRVSPWLGPAGLEFRAGSWGPTFCTLSFQPPRLMLAREETGNHPWAATETPYGWHCSPSETSLQHTSRKDAAVTDSEVGERPVRSPQTVSSRRASRLHIQQPLHPRTSGCPLGLDGQRQATQAWPCPHWPGRSKPARRNGDSEPPGGAGAQACARRLTGLPRSLLSPLGPSQHRDPGPRPPATWAPWPRGPHPTGAADCPRPRGCMSASGGPGLSTDPQDVARGAVPPPPRVTGETWPLGKDEAHLGDQGPWREGQSYGLRARASPHGYVLSSDRPEPSPRGGARAGRLGQEAWQAPTSAPPPVPRVLPGHECGHPGSACRPSEPWVAVCWTRRAPSAIPALSSAWGWHPPAFLTL